MEGMNQEGRTGPRPMNPEVHARICGMKISTSPHPSKMLQRGGNVFPLISKSDDSERKLTVSDEPK